MAISNITAIIKRELYTYFNSPVAYVFIVIFLGLTGFFTFMINNFFEMNESTLGGFFQWHPWLYLFLVPAAGMHLWADERRLGTLELFFTMPVTYAQAITAKFLAAWLFIAIALVLTFPMVITVSYLGNPDYGVIACGYIGSILLAGSYLAISGMTSAITRSQVVSFIISVVICLFLILAGWPPVTDLLVNWAPVQLVDIVSAFSVMPHFANIQRGVVDLRDIVYFLSIILFCLMTTGIILKNHAAG
ncbi:MAG TPA: ABC transporter permease [Lentisphaeria bacterium]|nr:MAG: ABC transporter permease [Lentisphaerae bacterium GWF2_49_21]HBC86783.1 ABC transporter permease [Lentisphaeria bacterium]